MRSSDLVRLAVLVDEHSTTSRLSRAKDLGGLCADALDMTGVALSIAGSNVNSTVCGTDVVILRLAELQLCLAEGPITDALDQDRPVLAPDISDVANGRWPWFTPAALRAGAAALFVLPLRAGQTRLGALSLYRVDAGDLTAQQFDDLQLLGKAAQSILIFGQAEPQEDPGSWAVGVESGFQAEIYQAVGAITVQLDVDGEQALARLRAHAYVVDRPISEVAADVLAGRLHLESDGA